MSIKPELRIIDGKIKYYYGEVQFDTFDLAQEYIDKEILKLGSPVLIPPEIEAMSAEERRAAIDEIAKREDKKTTKAVGLSGCFVTSY